MVARIQKGGPIGLVLILTWSAGLPRECRAAANEAGNLQEVLHSAAESILKITKDQPVSIGQFTPTGLPDANGGPAIGDLLRGQLEALKPGIVQRRAPFEVKGDYNLAPHPTRAEADQGQKVIRLLFRVIDAASGVESNLGLTRFLVDNTSIARLIGVSGPVPLDPNKDQAAQRRERNETIQNLARVPRVVVRGADRTLVASSKESPYAIEILAKPLLGHETRQALPRPARVEDGLAVVELDRGELYEIRIHNTSSEEVAARTFIDGLDVFHFSDDRDAKGQPRLAYFIVPPRSTQTIVGWHKSVAEKKFLSFLVTEYGKGASSQAGIAAQGPVGVIQVQFSRCSPMKPGAGRRGPTNETGFGPPRHVEQTEAIREIEPFTDSVSVRYIR